MKTLISPRIALPGFMLLTALMMLTLAGCDTQSSFTAEQMLPSPQPTSREISQPATVALIPDQIVLADNFGAWQYTTRKGGSGVGAVLGGIVINYGDVYGGVAYDNRSIQGIRDYAAANWQLVSRVAAHGGLVEVLITFHSYVPLDQFRAWVKIHGLAVGVSYVNLINNSGEHRRLIVCPYSDTAPIVQSDKPGFPPVYCPYHAKDEQSKLKDNGDPLPLSELNDYLNEYNAAEKDSTLRIIGVSFTRTWVDASQLPTIANDPLVYLADVTPDVVRMDLARAGVAGADTPAIEVDTPFPAMEQFGLDNFK